MTDFNKKEIELAFDQNNIISQDQAKELKNFPFWFHPYDDYLNHLTSPNTSLILQRIYFHASCYETALTRAREYAIRNNYALFRYENI